MTEDGIYFCSNCHCFTHKVLAIVGAGGNKELQCMVCRSPVTIMETNHDADRISRLEKKVEELAEEVRVLRGYILEGG